MRKTGAFYQNGQCDFVVWAPERNTMTLHIVSPFEDEVVMEKDQCGYFTACLTDIKPDIKYYYQPDGLGKYPDPSSYSQPNGVHRASELVDHNAYQWNDAHWRGIPLKDMVIYELHVGTFTPEGTFDAIIPRLEELKFLGINAIEIMPVAQFPGDRNWGYDGVYIYAVQNSYGGVGGLKRLVDACHQSEIAVMLDVVYNHLGPEGNYLSQFAPYFTDRYNTPWGDAINYDGEWSDGVREYFVQNAIYWFEEFHVDGLRLDAVHAIFDNNAFNFWELLHKRKNQAQQRSGRTLHLVAESDLNSPRTVKPIEIGGQGFDAQWLDDFHHALYVMLHPDGKDRYEDFGSIHQLVKAYKEGFVHSGEYVSFRKRRHGVSSAGIPGEQFIVFNQNHDQVGNRPLGERLCMLVDFERQKLAAAAVLLAPYVPMLFMGEEYADQSPFFYFVSHSDKKLIEAVREGRKKEFEAFKGAENMPDAQDEQTFLRSKLNWEKRLAGEHKIMWDWHQRLITLRRSHAALKNLGKNDIQVYPIANRGMAMQRAAPGGFQPLIILFNFSEQYLACSLPDSDANWHLIIHSRQQEWSGNMSDVQSITDHRNATDLLELPPLSVCVYEGSADLKM